MCIYFIIKLAHQEAQVSFINLAFHSLPRRFPVIAGELLAEDSIVTSSNYRLKPAPNGHQEIVSLRRLKAGCQRQCAAGLAEVNTHWSATALLSLYELVMHMVSQYCHSVGSASHWLLPL